MNARDVEAGEDNKSCHSSRGSIMRHGTTPSIQENPSPSEEALGGIALVKDRIQETLLQWEDDVQTNETIIRKIRSRNVVVNTMNRCTILRNIASRLPRTYYFLAHLVLPLFGLLAIAFVCGAAVAKLEYPVEIAANDAAVAATFAGYVDYMANLSSIRGFIFNVAEQCLEVTNASASTSEWLSASETQSLLTSIRECSDEVANQNFSGVEFYPTYYETAKPELSFSWSSCGRMALSNKSTDFSESDRKKQFKQYMHDFANDFLTLLNQTIFDAPNQISESVSQNYTLAKDALSQATGAKSCTPHYIGGAWFWFTVMTTIGYGIAVPTTTGGRLFVYTFGFLTIIGFIALNSTASAYMLTVVDDILLRLNLKRLTKGMAAVTLWFCLTVAWVLILSATIVGWVKVRINYDVSLSTAFWFSYVTVTTVGFGDTTLPQEEFTATDMFTIPLAILLGFVFLGNFATKLVKCLGDWFPADNTLERILAAGRTPSQKLQANVPFPNKSFTSLRTGDKLQQGIPCRRHSL